MSAPVRALTVIHKQTLLAWCERSPSVVAKPAGAELKTMPGFSVAPFVTEMEGARVIRVAPNGDIFVARSRPEGKVMVIRAKPGADKPDLVETFVSGLKDAYGIAFYPPGPEPKWIYIAGQKDVVRYPYKTGDLKPSGPAETVISDLAVGGGHWTRDIAFSPDGKTLYVAVGSSGNVAQDMGPKPELVSYQNGHALGSAWDREEWRANVFAYDPDGKNKRVYATGTPAVPRALWGFGLGVPRGKVWPQWPGRSVWLKGWVGARA
jgi:glucose/arabinose dehydrogenase